MLESILGSINCERVLIFILARKQGYAREMARFYEASLDPIQKQLKKLELGGVLASHSVGRTRLYSFNPSYPYLNELVLLLEKALSSYPDEARKKLSMEKPSPTRRSKPPENLSRKWNLWQPEP